MKALVCRELGPPERLVVADVADPEPGERDVVIDVHAAGVNFPDGLIIQGKYQVSATPPFVPGMECAGVVAAVGTKVRHLRPGARVMAFASHGAFAERMRCSATAVIPMPDALDFATASAFVLAYATSYHALVDRGALKVGETLLVLGAGGGVGLAAVEIGKALGARVIAAASSAAKLDICRARGADMVIDYRTDNLRDRLVELAPDGVDVVFDPIGGLASEIALRRCAWRGRFLVVGFASGNIAQLPANLVLLKGASQIGVFWAEYARREPGRTAADLVSLFGWLREGKLRPHVSRLYALDQGSAAIRSLLDREAVGKVAIAVRSTAD